MKFFGFLIIILSLPCYAGRPLITDDDQVVGDDQEQLETWIYSDERSFQHWVVPTFGLGKLTEVSASFVHGVAFLPRNELNEYSIAGPILQAKVKLPWFAIAAGTIVPLGNGIFTSPTWEYFFYGAHSADLNGDGSVLLHLNLGGQTRTQLKDSDLSLLWGVAAEFRVQSKTHLFTEVANGEVYAFIPGIATQVGFRHDWSDHLQLDGTLGKGLTGNPLLPIWITLGVKYANDII